MSGEGRRHQLAGKPLVTRWILRQAYIRTPPVRLRIINATVGIELQHVRRAC